MILSMINFPRAIGIFFFLFKTSPIQSTFSMKTGSNNTTYFFFLQTIQKMKNKIHETVKNVRNVCSQL